jgi:hypothetical protein
MTMRRTYFKWMGAYWSAPRDVVQELFRCADQGLPLDLSKCRQLNSRPPMNAIPTLRDHGSRLREE